MRLVERALIIDSGTGLIATTGETMAIKDDIDAFLRKNPHIAKINFAFGSLLVYPSAYQRDVADAIASEQIKIRLRGPSSAAAGASYDVLYDSLELSPTFSSSSSSDQAFLVHECTHAHFDIQSLGPNSAHENEAAAYLAEAVFLEAAGQPPLGSQPIRVVSHSIAKTVLTGTYAIPAGRRTALVTEIAKHPHYATTVTYESNGFDRNFVHRVLR